MKSHSLNGKWNLYYFDYGEFDVKKPDDLGKYDIKKIEATVPGNVELDLAAAGVLPLDLFKGENILKTEEYETYEWWYEREFPTPEHKAGDKINLHFEGVDCIAEYWVNGQKVGETANALIPHDIDVTDAVKKSGKNTLVIRVLSGITKVWSGETPMYSLSCTCMINGDSLMLRKPPHAFGWDIMPRAVSAGIWRDASVEVLGDSELEQLLCYTEMRDGKYVLQVCYDVITAPSKELYIEIEGICGDSRFYKKERAYFKAGRVRIDLDNPKLWWPYGYGDANLYETTINFYKGDKLICSKTLNIGIRTVDLVRTDATDGVNGEFKFVVNGVDIMCKGSNWVPMDAFHSRDKARYKKALELVRDIGCNILRCWGGNVYEDHEFFDFCDANGIMVWQDFAMACHQYPQTDEFLAVMKEEATAIVKKLRNHPSIVLWAGDNECDAISYQDFRDSANNRITREILPRVVLDNDMRRPYLASSPYISSKICNEQRMDMISENHLWGPRDYFKSTYYLSSNAHFVSEIGYHGCPDPEQLAKFLDKDHLWPNTGDSQWTLHSSDQKGSDHRVRLVADQTAQLFGTIPKELDDYAFASQISQAEAKKFFIESMRTNRPDKTGIIWWNLIDGWPQVSDAVVGYYYDKKIAYDYIKRSQQPFAIMCRELSQWNLTVVAGNDTLETVSGSYKVTDMDSGRVMAEGDFTAAPNGCTDLAKIPIMYSAKGMFLIEWNIKGERFFNHYLYGYPAFDLDTYKKWYKMLK